MTGSWEIIIQCVYRMSDDKILGTEENLEENLLKFANSFDDAKEKVWEVIVFGLNEKKKILLTLECLGEFSFWIFDWIIYQKYLF